jgi:hypothetical protein
MLAIRRTAFVPMTLSGSPIATGLISEAVVLLIDETDRRTRRMVG